MSDSQVDEEGEREATLRRLAARACDHDAVANAFVAKSFTDLLVVVDLEPDESGVPTETVDLLESHGCRGANEVYDRAAEDRSSVGESDGAARHQFVDTETRGEHRSYVVD
ncbi:hypothetical protein [Halobellus limi]|uniref:Uncharacterized protein n=1 Tax=Halobellus limi TaxID=699433 RepID=A0A1H6BBE5_9EURY|nr:hypothetical protein [Halobellus limi]QCC49241.1 hypothetical protein DV707_15950 [Halobellus limi]SEG57982.1 hypothetical protein SAMN04488133_2716 [Halobellus limi]